MSAADIVNAIEIDDRTMLAGQPTEAQLRALAGEGFDTVINLAPASTVDGVEIDEAAILAETGLRYHHIPVPWSAPDRQQFDAFVSVLDATSGGRVLIHCAINYRVTAFYSRYAMRRLGWDEATADALMDRVWTSRPDVTLSEPWRRFLDDVSPGA